MNYKKTHVNDEIEAKLATLEFKMIKLSDTIDGMPTWGSRWATDLDLRLTEYRKMSDEICVLIKEQARRMQK